MPRARADALGEQAREIGSSCIAERRRIEIVDEGEPRTSLMSYGDVVRMDDAPGDRRLEFGPAAGNTMTPLCGRRLLPRLVEANKRKHLLRSEKLC